MLRFDEVSLDYGTGTDVLDGLSLDFEPGSFHFILGDSGAGKSSVLRLMSLSGQPTRGRVVLFGRDTASLMRDERALLRRRIGVVFQDFHLLDHLTVLQNAALPLLVAGKALEEVRGDVVELLAWVGLAGHIDALPPTLSGGQQQRVAVARAVVGQPSLILADEPTGSLDDRLALRLIHLFEELNKMGTTVVIATHNETLARRFAYPIGRIAAGHLTFESPAAGATDRSAALEDAANGDAGPAPERRS